jgi:hypothetical protein
MHIISRHLLRQEDIKLVTNSWPLTGLSPNLRPSRRVLFLFKRGSQCSNQSVEAPVIANVPQRYVAPSHQTVREELPVQKNRSHRRGAQLNTWIQLTDNA